MPASALVGRRSVRVPLGRRHEESACKWQLVLEHVRVREGGRGHEERACEWQVVLEQVRVYVTLTLAGVTSFIDTI